VWFTKLVISGEVTVYTLKLWVDKVNIFLKTAASVLSCCAKQSSQWSLTELMTQ